MPYWCGDCRSYFSVKTGTVTERSPLPLRKWVYAIYLHLTSLKGVSSMKLHREIDVTQKTAWYMLQRIRKAFDRDDDDHNDPLFTGPVEADETYVGGKRKNMPKSKRKELTGRGVVGKAAIAGVKDRETGKIVAEHADATDMPTLATFVAKKTKPGAFVFTDEAAAYKVLRIFFRHRAVNHGDGEYVRGETHCQGIEAFWSMFKRGFQGTYHKMSAKHLHRYVAEFSGRHNIRERDTLAQMADVAVGMVGKSLPYAALIADNGLASGARS